MSNMNQTIIEAFDFRHATKKFNSNKKISEEDFDTILESGRLSPSSLGLEPWRFVVIQNKKLRDKLKPYSWGAQKQLDTASHFVLIFARKNVTAHSNYVQHLIRGIKEYEDSTIPAVEEKFDNFQASFHIADNDRTLYDWASKQTYIALGNMMTSAALLGIDSCPMEGFDLDKVTEILSEEGILDTEHFGISVMVAFGYRAQEPAHGKIRQSKEDVISWIE
ncbi:NAD(P)H-dependent oxidoreductase [Staphylococcus saccharolyticus]|uniref:NAD(P)H-flavin oxidoreductase n=1 Tax=Staphylococcus saccharolyticus TaxID=33028 RepID=A0A380H016_9STAP|nr:NAD(P)H-dependent oxidoreductase [Staphylococcus saccharolyticus]MBS9783666.1 NAD(P)H-dependent oxidoreductase [Pasteurella sp.]MBL7564723.1 NAD(P)H-dependent oxidoreductase [Staphylococcus saccharolyticus]MBL7571013.1 NAD(P)H-dependent oxidoreductase [Staphylococcus saccharolyticus]QQB98864.1 NAD(P)H-dependent oxidoreductase [Staphylococcus saccharolyticus]QRJ66921.1 NAD(P)H-dependent oxidoreductase [Staphylococcus saccharolyticus]